MESDDMYNCVLDRKFLNSGIVGRILTLRPWQSKITSTVTPSFSQIFLTSTWLHAFPSAS